MDKRTQEQIYEDKLAPESYSIDKLIEMINIRKTKREKSVEIAKNTGNKLEELILSTRNDELDEFLLFILFGNL